MDRKSLIGGCLAAATLLATQPALAHFVRYTADEHGMQWQTELPAWRDEAREQRTGRPGHRPWESDRAPGRGEPFEHDDRFADKGDRHHRDGGRDKAWQDRWKGRWEDGEHAWKDAPWKDDPWKDDDDDDDRPGHDWDDDYAGNDDPGFDDDPFDDGEGNGHGYCPPAPEPSPVPVPAAAWLFGSGLLGLTGFTRRRRRS